MSKGLCSKFCHVTDRGCTKKIYFYDIVMFLLLYSIGEDLEDDPCLNCKTGHHLDIVDKQVYLIEAFISQLCSHAYKLKYTMQVQCLSTPKFL